MEGFCVDSAPPHPHLGISSAVSDTLPRRHASSCLRTRYKFTSAHVVNSRFAFLAMPR